MGQSALDELGATQSPNDTPSNEIPLWATGSAGDTTWMTPEGLMLSTDGVA